MNSEQRELERRSGVMDVEERLSFNPMSSGFKRALALMIYPTKTGFPPVSDSDDHIIGVLYAVRYRGYLV